MPTQAYYFDVAYNGYEEEVNISFNKIGLFNS